MSCFSFNIFVRSLFSRLVFLSFLEFIFLLLFWTPSEIGAGGKNSCPPSVFAMGVQKSKKKINSKNERKTRREKRDLAKILNEKQGADRKTTSTTPTQVPVIEKPICQMGHVKQGTPRPSVRTPRIISQEALILFSLAAVGIKRLHPITKNNQDYKNKTFGEIHSQQNPQHF